MPVIQKCFVPNCGFTSADMPPRIFFHVPRNETRHQWFAAAGKKPADKGKRLSLKTILYCCDAHFDLHYDVDDYEVFKICKAQGSEAPQLKLKKGVIPHIFPTVTPSDENLFEENIEQERENTPVAVPSKNIMVEPAESVSCVFPCADKNASQSAVLSSSTSIDHESIEVSSPVKVQIDPAESLSYAVSSQGKDLSRQNPSFDIPTPLKAQVKSRKQEFAAPIEGRKRKKCDMEPVETPTRLRRKRIRNERDDFVYDFSQSSSSGTGAVSDNPLSQEFKEKEDKLKIRELNLKLMKNNPKFFLGLNPKAFSLIERLANYTKCSEEKILISLRKIRLNEPAELLGFMLGYCVSYIGRILKETIPKVADYLRTLIFQPRDDIIQANLPIPFRAFFKNVGFIFDCFEVEIEKPSNPLIQALTWSQYKKGNTLKYLVSATPDGYINFISAGFGGRATDQVTVENSGVLDILRPGLTVMADRGFKNVAAALENKGSKLVRPPSVKAGEQLSKKDVREAKVIASLRIHIERVIGRLRDYDFISPHSLFHHDLMCLADSVVIIAAALANLQSPLIKV